MTKAEISRRNGRQKRIAKQRQIADEFGEPFWEVIQGFADLGYGKHGTAGAIGWDASSFCRMCQAEGRHIQWPAYQDLKVWRDREYSCKR